MPEIKDGLSNLTYVKNISTTVVLAANKDDTVVVSKSTVPVIDYLKQSIITNYTINIDGFNMEFSKEGSVIYDSFHGD